jgi:tRNA A-37 threonylcarbamoyl transferase component Bud32
MASGAAVAVGQVLGRYRLTEKLGEGGMGVVFVGVHETLGREVAVKLLRREVGAHPLAVARFRQEAEAVSRIGHPNIVSIYDFGRLADGSLYYVMERVQGESLAARIDRAPAMTAEELLSIFSQICRALAATHNLNIVHRDLKPENVVVGTNEDGRVFVKLLDFGIAKLCQIDDAQPLTMAGTAMGTPNYMAPEQMSSAHDVDARADLYSLGAILYEIFAGEPPWGYADPLEIITRGLSETVPPPSAISSQPIPPRVEAFIVRALARSPQDRPSDAQTFYDELEDACRLPPTEPEAETPVRLVAPIAAMRRPRWRKWTLGGGALLLVVSLAAIAVRLGGASKVDSSQARARQILAAALHGEVEEERLALDSIAEVGSRAFDAEIAAALEQKNPEVRRAAAMAAWTAGDAGLIAALRAAEERSSGAVALEMAAARYHLGDDTAAEPLERARSSRDPALHLRALLALGEKGGVAAPELRAALLAAPAVRRSLRVTARAILARLGESWPAELGAADAPGSSDIGGAALVEALGNADPQVRAHAALALGRSPSLSAGMADRLAALLGDANLPVRVAAATSLLASSSRGP